MKTDNISENKNCGKIEASEMILNSDGSIFHLHILPEDLADNIILVGDPGRVKLVGSLLDFIEVSKENREFHTITGKYNGKRVSVISTGIGPDNIDIVLNEIDALVNIDFKSGLIKDTKKSLNIVRIGTCGCVQADISVGSYVLSEKHIGCDGVLRFYKDIDHLSDKDFEEAFIKQCNWTANSAKPYVINPSKELIEKLYSDETYKGITLTAVGFYGPQGRMLRAPIMMPNINELIANFKYKGYKIINYEMESAVIAGLSKILGHNAATICLVVANRNTGEALANYYPNIKELIKYTLNKLLN